MIASSRSCPLTLLFRDSWCNTPPNLSAQKRCPMHYKLNISTIQTLYASGTPNSQPKSNSFLGFSIMYGLIPRLGCNTGISAKRRTCIVNTIRTNWKLIITSSPYAQRHETCRTSSASPLVGTQIWHIVDQFGQATTDWDIQSIKYIDLLLFRLNFHLYPSFSNLICCSFFIPVTSKGILGDRPADPRATLRAPDPMGSLPSKHS